MNDKIRKVKVHKEILMKDLTVIYVFILLNFLSVIAISNIQQEDFLNKFTIISLIQLVINILFLKACNHKFFSLPILFVIFTFVFHLGHLVLITFNIDVERPYDVVNMVSNQVFIKACIFTYLAQAFLVLGIMLSNLKKTQIIIADKHYDEIEKRLTYKTGITLFLISIIPKLYIDIQKIILYMNGNYLSTYEIDVSGALTTVANMAEIAVIMIMIGKQDHKKLVKFIFFLTLLYEVIIMMTGNRGRPTVYIFSLIYIYINLIQQVRLRTTVVAVTAGYVGIVFINFISKIRLANITDITLLIRVFKEVFVSSPFFKMIGEFGGTMISLCYSIMFFPTNSVHSYGSNYLVSLLTIIPNFGGILEQFRNQFIFVYNFPGRVRYALGGSYLGELYYAFGMYGSLGAIIVGLLIGNTQRVITESINNKNWLKLSIYMILFPSFLWWVRNYFSDMIREFVWSSVLIYLMYYFIKQSKKRFQMQK